MFHEIISEIERVHARTNTVPTLEQLAESLNVSIELIQDTFDHPDFRALLEKSYFAQLYTNPKPSLSTQQLLTLNVLANQYDRRTPLQKFKELKITSQQFNRWMQDPIFADALNSRVTANFEKDGWRVFQSILENAATGDNNAAKFYMELTGRYTPTAHVSSRNVNVSMKAVDLLVEVLQRHLSNHPDILEAIGKDFYAVVNGEPLPSVSSNPALPPVEIRSGSANQTQIDKTSAFIEHVASSYEEDDLGF